MSRDPLFPTPPPRYERPQGSFQCGDAAHGNPCPLGPLVHGVCSRERDCQPVQRDGRWFCTRSIAAGGPCTEGPSPTGACGQPPRDCLPLTTLRKQRGWFVLATFAATVGILLVLGARQPKRWFAPGPLTSNHARLLSQSSQGNRCEACHPAGSEPVSAWFASLVGVHAASQPTQTDLCLQCHGHLAPEPRNAHGLSAETMRASQTLHTGTQTDVPDAIPQGPFSTHNKQWACSVCHQEHHGSQHDLTALSDRQCATCHQDAFHDFVNGHPEFKNWPQATQPAIAFNHSTHQLKYYVEAKRDYSCRECHRVDQLDHSNSVSYEACQSCHETKIRTAGEAGIPLLSLPIFDLSAMQSQLKPEDDWPQIAQGSFDGSLPPWMYLLLLADAEIATILGDRGPSFDLIDLETTSPSDMEQAARLMRAIRRLCDEMASDARTCVAKRLNTVTHHTPSEAELDILLGGLPQAFVRETIATWFAGSEPDSDDSSARAISPRTNHLSVQLAQATDDDLLTASPSDDDEDEDDAQTLNESDTEETLSDSTGSSNTSDDLLLDDSTDLSTQTPVDANDPNRGVPLLSVPLSGWRRSEFGQQLVYQPRGHNDPFVAAWLSSMVQRHATREPSKDSVNAIREHVLKLPLFQNCTTCHRTPGTSREMAWKSPPASSLKAFTKFSHRPHLLQPDLQDCQHCHVTSTDDATQTRLTDSQETRSVVAGTIRDFQPIHKASCATCHRPQGASDRCLECHHYHVQQPNGITE